MEYRGACFRALRVWQGAAPTHTIILYSEFHGVWAHSTLSYFHSGGTAHLPHTHAVCPACKECGRTGVKQKRDWRGNGRVPQPNIKQSFGNHEKDRGCREGCLEELERSGTPVGT